MVIVRQFRKAQGVLEKSDSFLSKIKRIPTRDNMTCNVSSSQIIPEHASVHHKSAVSDNERPVFIADTPTDAETASNSTVEPSKTLNVNFLRRWLVEKLC